MATQVTLNAVNYSIPATGEGSWGTNVSSYLIALSTGVLSKAGGPFTLTADIDFGASFGIKSIYYKSRGTAASAGVLRLASTETIAWRNNANSSDLALTTTAGDILQFAGNPILTLALGSAYKVLQMDSGGTAYSWATPTGTGAPVLATAPTMTTPVLGVASATSINKVTITTPATGSTLTIADGKTLTASNTLTFTGTDSTSFAFPSGSSTVLTLASVGTITGAKTFAQTTLLLQDNSTNAVTLSTTNSTTSYTIKLPAVQGGASTTLSNDGSGNLTWASTASSTLNQFNTDIGNSSNTRTSTNTNLLGDVKAKTLSQTATVTIATPGVFTSNSHGMAIGDKFYLTTSGALPTGLSASTTYYASNIATNTFNASTTLANAMAGTYITTSGSQSGTHTLFTGGLVLGQTYRGRTTSSAQTSGYIGESGYSSQATATAMGNNAYVVGASTTLTPGTYLIIAMFTSIAVTSDASFQVYFGPSYNSGSYVDLIQCNFFKSTGQTLTDGGQMTLTGVVNFDSAASSAARTVAARCQTTGNVTGTFTSNILWVRIA